MVTTWRNRANMLSGCLLGYGLFLFLSYLDLLHAYTSPQSSDDAGLDGELVAIHLLFAGLSVGGFALWAVPHVRTGPGVVQVINPLTRWVLPPECLETLREGIMFPRLKFGDRVVRLWGLERSVADHLRGHIVVPVVEPPHNNAPAVEYGVKRSLRPGLILLACLWIAITLAGLLGATG
ncbi:hypothetical protein GCM10022415_15730 [Knoellia locipacati]|uniref:Uncharacterized protein n=1 Tax=Knoellia locipacati TaxID=882824 RepID=A0A512T031_9MICO|nr:hypothetical protein [Knoellia locipacati]GEQ13523.1 hypothetical protein KLO01_15700 [Knoellia locipacati]